LVDDIRLLYDFIFSEHVIYHSSSVLGGLYTDEAHLYLHRIFFRGYNRDMFRTAQPSQSVTQTVTVIDKKQNSQLNNNFKQNNNLKGTPRRLNSVKNIVTTRNQFINTYLTFAYEMRTGMESRIFWRYVILLLDSIDRIAGVTSNSEKNTRLFRDVYLMKGIVSDQEQQYWSSTFRNLIHKINTINSTTTRSMYNRLPIK